MKKLSANPIYDKLLNYIPLVLAGLMPLFFLPITTEFFEFNKQVLLIIGTIVLLVTWAIKILFGKQMEVTRSSLDTAIVAFLGVAIISTMFSIDKMSSIYGSMGRGFPSLLGYITLALFYYLVSSGISSVKVMKNILLVLVASVSLNSFVSILSYFGLYLGSAAFLQIPNFTLTGSITVSVLIAAIASVISMSLLSTVKESNLRTGLIVSTILNIFFVSLINLTSGWIVLAVGTAAIIWVLKADFLKKHKLELLGAVVFAVVMFGVKNLPQTRGFLTNANYPYEIVLPVKASWAVTTSILRDYPMLATGPSTFYLNFTRYRPLNLNNTDLWNIRFDKPFNEILNVTAELGLIGFIALLFLMVQVYKMVGFSVKVKEENHIIKVLGVAVLTASSLLFVTYATTLTAFVIVLLLATLVRSFHLEESLSNVSRVSIVQLTKAAKTTTVTGLALEAATKNTYLKYVIVIPCLIFALYMGYVTSRNYLAELFTRSAIYAAQNNEWDKVYKAQENAIKASPRRDTLYTRHAQTILALANSIAAKENLNEEDKALIQNLIAQSINVAKVASENINPLNVRNWETRALVYKNISKAAQNALDWSIASYNIAIQLDPTNPMLRLDIGGMYYAKEDYLSAASQFRQAISLKPNYANAYYNFGQSLLKLGDYANAKAALETAKSLVPENSADYNRVVAEIAEIEKKINVAGAMDQKPTVEELEAQNDKTQPTTQEPLNKVGEEKPEITENITEETLPKQQ